MKHSRVRFPAFRFRTQLTLNSLLFSLILSVLLVAGYGTMMRKSIVEQNCGMMEYASQELSKSLKTVLKEYSSIAQQRIFQMHAIEKAVLLKKADRKAEIVLTDLRDIVAAQYIGYIDSIRLHAISSDAARGYLPILRLRSQGYIIGPLRMDERGQKVFSLYAEIRDANDLQAVILEMRVYETVLLELFAHAAPQYDTFILYNGYVMSSSARSCVGKSIDMLQGPSLDMVKQGSREATGALPFWREMRLPYAAGCTQIDDWRVITCVDYTTMMNQFTRAIPRLLSIALFAVAVDFLLHQRFSKRMNRKMQRLYQKMSALSKGDFQTQLLIPGGDEFSELALALDQTGQKINSLIRQIYQMGDEKAAAQMRMLRSQINEHFLLNSLNSLKWLVIAEQQNTALEGIDVLSSYLRISLRTKEDRIPALTEISQIQSFVYLLKLRYRNRLQVTYEMKENQLDQLLTLRFILQPFVENAVLHAWKNDGGALHIGIRCRATETKLIFEIQDDGIGMKQEAVDALFQEEETKGRGCGVRNVIERLKYVYGQQARVRVVSQIDQGTKIIIEQPLAQAGGEEFH